MGLLDGTTQSSYYSSTNKGDYQFVSLDDVISSFMVVYVGENKILNKVSRTDVQFHGMRAIQELSYDVLRSHKSFEQEVPSTLIMPLPQDYVNYTKVVRVDSKGIEKPLYPTGKTSNPFPIQQNASLAYEFTSGGILQDQGNSLSASAPYQSDTLTRFKTIEANNVDYDYDDGDLINEDFMGRRYGLDPQHAQINGTFYIDNSTGFIHFGSDLAGETITLKYISDGLGTDAEMLVHKFCEEALYKWIMYGLISTRTGIPEYIVNRYKKERFAETRKAKIRLSNIKMEEFTQVLKGLSKPIK
jgi:hypothetical protein|tara:strand:+ start:498 stop:1400 length:903 start_codon:yes stop_codon:yes gene_type:complete